MEVLFRENLRLIIASIFAEPEGKLVVLDVTCGSEKASRLLAIYAPYNARWSDFFRRLDTFPNTSCNLVELGNLNRIFDAHVDCVGSNINRIRNPYLKELFNKFQVANCFRLDYPDTLR